MRVAGQHKNEKYNDILVAFFMVSCQQPTYTCHLFKKCCVATVLISTSSGELIATAGSTALLYENVLRPFGVHVGR